MAMTSNAVFFSAFIFLSCYLFNTLPISILIRIGPKIKWQQVAYFIEGRTAQQCSQRYLNSLDCKAVGNWSPEEDDALLKACQSLKIGTMETEIRPVSHRGRKDTTRLSKKFRIAC